MKVSDSQYADMVKEIREIYENNGVKVLCDIDAYGINQYHKSEKVMFIFYWPTLDKIMTPHGSITLGSMSGIPSSFVKALDEIKDKFNLRFLKETNPERVKETSEKFIYYSLAD